MSIKSLDRRPRVVIIGAGFAGINAANSLASEDVDVVIIDRNNFHTFQPLLYQVATAYLPPEGVGSNVRTIFRSQKNAEVRVGEVVGADWKLNKLIFSDGQSLEFDYLLIAGGATTNYFGIPGMEENSWPLYTLADAIKLRRHLLEELEQSVLKDELNAHESTVVVIGGGPTGVEMAGALKAMANDNLGKDAHGLHVILIEAMDRLLGNFSEKSSEFAVKDLKDRGVDVRLNTKVASADANGITLEDGTRINAKTVVWAAGVRAKDIGSKFNLETGRGGAIVVDRDLRIPGKDNVFAAGDIAFIKDKPIPGLAPAAIQGGKHVAKNISRLIKGRPTTVFNYKNKGIMAILGRGDAVAELPGGIKSSGIIAWLLWLAVHVMYLIGFRNKLKVLIDWGWSYISSRGSSAVFVPDRDLFDKPKSKTSKVA